MAFCPEHKKYTGKLGSACMYCFKPLIEVITMTPEQKAKELQDNLNNEIQKVTQQYFDGAICFDEIIIGVQMVLMKYKSLEDNAVNDITSL